MSGPSSQRSMQSATIEPDSQGISSEHGLASSGSALHNPFANTPFSTPRRVSPPISSRKPPTVPPTSFSTYLSARTFMPPTRPTPTFNQYQRTRHLPESQQGVMSRLEEEDFQGENEDTQIGNELKGGTSSTPESHYDRWAKHWTKNVIALNTGLRRPPVLPINEKAHALLELEHEKRKAEIDAEMLRNRVMALREQERRVMVRTNQAQERVKSLQRIKAMKDSKKGFRDELKTVHAMQQYQEAQQRRQQELARLDNYRQYRKQIQELKAERAKQAQMERAEMERRRRLVQEAQVNARREQFKLVRGFETLARNRIQQEEIMRKAEIERMRAARAIEAEQKREAALGETQQLIMEEQELLQKLAIRRQQHSQAFEQLASELQPTLRSRDPLSSRSHSDGISNM